MDERNMETNQEIEIDLQRLLGALLNKSWLIGIVAVACAIVTFLSTYFFVTPKYKASVMFYVNNSSVGDLIGDLTSSDISASRAMVKTYIVILKTNETLTEVIDYADVDLTIGQVAGMISAESVDATEVFRVVVTSTDPNEAEAIANAIGLVLPDRIESIIESTSSKVVEAAVLPTAPSSPNYTTNTMIGFVLGLFVTAVIIAIWDISDIRIRSEEDVTRLTTHPLLVAVPDMESHSKGGYYGYRKVSAYDNTKENGERKHQLVGENLNFAASEAYKLLRTKLQFSFADEGKCRVIAVSSALTGEGKSLTAVNLAYSMSQLGKRVLLMDCDMRRPSISDKLPVKQSPGLSDYLSVQVAADKLIQPCGLESDSNAFHVIAAGRIPPNPMELLSSKRMEKTLHVLKESYDYIILDLPPVGEVGDALAIAKWTDGVLLLTRQHVCNRLALRSAIRQFEFVEAKILGIVLNCATEEVGSYNKRYYKKYGYGYYRRSKSYGYAKAATVSTEKAADNTADEQE